MDLYESILCGKDCISVIGLGYVGLNIAVEFGKVVNVIGFDLNQDKLNSYIDGIGITNEISDESLQSSQIFFTSSEKDLSKAKFHIIAVPTPIYIDKTPNLECLLKACESVGNNLKKGDVVVIESTVYPGVTEELCIPILEKKSGLKCGEEFKVGYSPERISPGDKVHTLKNMLKIVSGIDEEALETIAKVYGIIIKDDLVYKAESIKIAEAAKVVENTQRDINISLINELSVIFNKMEIDTQKVLEAAATKWNFYNVKPGLVGGHCIGVDPYYLIYKAKMVGCEPLLMTTGRQINENLGTYIVKGINSLLEENNLELRDKKILIVGLSYKQNIGDTRNTKIIDMVNELKSYTKDIYICDYLVDKELVNKEYKVNVHEFDDINDVDIIIFAVPHDKYNNIDLNKLKAKYKNKTRILVDLKNIYNKEQAIKKGYIYWSL